jgi:hypothetical protein
VRRARPILLSFLSAAAAACTCSTAPGPVLVEVEPDDAPGHLDVALRIAGYGFAPAVQADFDDPARSQVDGTFEAALVDGPIRIALTDVSLLSEEEIGATLPAGSPPGEYDLEVVDPRGRIALLPSAFEIFAAECFENQTPCEDGDLCTIGDVCLGWRCRAGDPVTCRAADACRVAGTCDPTTGLCSDPNAEDGTPCSVSCPVGDTCQAGVCTPAVGGCLNAAPLARLSVGPGGGTAGETLFAFDASASADAEDPLASLQFRFDADGDGTWDGPFSSDPSLDHVHALPGIFSAAVEALDSGGLSGYATALVVVAAPGDEVRVTTAADERDAGATPDAPGGTGLSLREAIAWVNGQATPKTIVLAAPLDIVMTGAQRGLALLAPGAAVVGEPGVTLDFGGFNQACLRLQGPRQRLVGLTLVGCDGTFVSMTGSSQGSQVAQVAILGSGGTTIGIDALAHSPTGSPPASTIGPGNDLSGLAIALNVIGTDYQVVGNLVHGNEIGCVAYGERALFFRNVFARQVAAGPLAGAGLRIYGGVGRVEVRHNVFDRNGASGLQANPVAALEIRNNLFTGNAGFGVSSLAAGLTLDHNGYFANALGAVSSGLATSATDVLLDPLYMDGPGGDYRLLPASPAVDAGIDDGLDDANGPGPGRYDGEAPDLGAGESPY